jgi:hypothetical protein
MIERLSQRFRIQLLGLGMVVMFATGIVVNFGPILFATSQHSSIANVAEPSDVHDAIPIVGGAFRDVATADESRAVLREPRCVMFIHVIWSVASQQAQETLEQVASLMRGRHEAHAPVFFRVDVSEMQSELKAAVREFLVKNGLRDTRILVVGWGGIVWVKDGAIVDHEMAAYDKNVEEILSRSRQLQLR